MEENLTDELKCDNCGKLFRPGNDREGLPNGVGVVLASGRIISYCRECIIEEGKKAKKGANSQDGKL